MTDLVFSLEKVTKTYAEANHALTILKGVDLQVQRGEMLAIIGASGSGKSTLLHLMGLLDLPSSGNLYLEGENMASMSEKKRSFLRNQKLGFVYQFHHLLPEFSALDNVAMPLMIRRVDENFARTQAQQLLQKVGLNDRALHRPSELSGGERQRVALARALVTNPLVVLADEPTGNLDSETAQSMFQLLKEVNEEFNTAFVIVTHDPQLAQLAHRQMRMDKGVLVSS